MIWARLVLSYSLPILCGFVAVASMYKCRPFDDFYEKLSFSLGAGLGLLSFAAFLLGVAGMPFTFSSMTIALFAVTSPFALILYRGVSSGGAAAPPGAHGAGQRSARAWEKALYGALVLWIFLKAAFILYGGFQNPFTSYDFWANWGAAGKFFYYNEGLALDPHSEFFFGRGYRPFLGHPLLTTLTQVWVASSLGGFHEVFVKSWSSLYYVSLLAAFALVVRKDGGWRASILAAFALSTLPLLTFHGRDGYADLALAFYVLAGVVFFRRYMLDRNAGAMALSGLFLAMAAFTKNEGLLYLFFTGLSLSLYVFFARAKGGRVAPLASFALPALAYILPWLAFKAYYGIGAGHGYESSGIDWSESAHFEVLPMYFKEVFFTANHGLVFAFLLVMTVVGIRTVLKGDIKYLYAPLLLFMGALLFLYVATWDFTAVLDNTGSNRNTLGFTPFALYLSVLIYLDLSGRGNERLGAGFS